MIMKIKENVLSVQCAVMRDWQSEIIEDNHPVLNEIWNIKHMVFFALSMREYDDYMKLQGLDRELYIRKKALSLIQI